MGSSEEQTSAAVRMAQEDDLSEGVPWASLENQQAWQSPGLKSERRMRLLLGALKAVALIAPVGGLLLPIGNPGTGTGAGGRSIMESDGFAGDGLRTMALWVFWIAAIGQVWTIVDWWRLGRHRSGTWITCSILAVVCSGLSLWWFASLLRPLSYEAVRVPIALTLVIAVVALALQLVWSTPGDAHDVQMQRHAATFRALPASEQQALREERQQIIDALIERGAVTPEKGAEALAVPLGDWYLLGREDPVR